MYSRPRTTCEHWMGYENTENRIHLQIESENKLRINDSFYFFYSFVVFTSFSFAKLCRKRWTFEWSQCVVILFLILYCFDIHSFFSDKYFSLLLYLSLCTLITESNFFLSYQFARRIIFARCVPIAIVDDRFRGIATEVRGKDAVYRVRQKQFCVVAKKYKITSRGFLVRGYRSRMEFNIISCSFLFLLYCDHKKARKGISIIIRKNHWPCIPFNSN